MKSWKCDAENAMLYCIEDDTYVGLVTGLLEIAVKADKSADMTMRVCDFGTYADGTMFATVVVSTV